jgi:hypothetical protein
MTLSRGKIAQLLLCCRKQFFILYVPDGFVCRPESSILLPNIGASGE